VTELDMLLEAVPETLPIALLPQAIRELQDEVKLLRRELEDCQEDLRDHKEQNPCRLIDVGDGGMSRERAEADAFNRGIRAGREQIVSYLGLQAAVFTMNVEQMGKNIRTMKFPVDK
jgi:hypothetical protein